MPDPVATPTPEPKPQPVSDEFDPELDLDPADYSDLLPPEPKAEAKPEPKPEPKPQPTVERHQHSQSMRTLAAQLGMARSEVESMTPADLRAEIDLLLRSRDTGRTSQPAATPAPAAPPEPPKKKALPGFENEEEWDERLIGALAKYDEERFGKNQSGDEKLTAMEKELAELRQWKMQQESHAFTGRLDKLFHKHPHVFGTESSLEIDATSPQAIRRQTLYQQIQRLAQEGKLTTLEKDFAGAFELLFGAMSAPSPEPETDTLSEQYAANGAGNARVGRTPPKDAKTGRFIAAEGSDEDEERYLAGGTLPRPTAQAEPELPHGEDRAVRNLAARMRARGAKYDD